jgi:GTPase SAR1 family protein
VDLAGDAAAAASASAGAASASMDDKPTVAIVIGMAGSGKTSLMQRVNAYKHAQGKPPYIINLDPAVTQTPYDANVDIRDTVDYKNVMKEYNLGPNGGILTASNLFATRFDQVVSLCEKRSKELDNVFVDTPGQIEIFTWSASGAIVTESFASAFPTVVLYVVDTPRALNPQSFMSNMLQAVSILYKTRLPLIVVFNKIDVARHETMTRWMEDFETFHAALDDVPDVRLRPEPVSVFGAGRVLQRAESRGRERHDRRGHGDSVRRHRARAEGVHGRVLARSARQALGARRGGGGAATRDDGKSARRPRG